MPAKFELRELAIAISIRNYDPSILTPGLLQSCGLIPADWELAQPPIANPNFAQVGYRNGIGVNARRDRLAWVEDLRVAKSGEALTPVLARRYTEIFPNADYRALGLSFRGYLPFEGEPEGARRYLFSTFFAPNPWQDFGEAPVEAGINLQYTVENKKFNLNVLEAMLNADSPGEVPLVLFTGLFDYPFQSESPSERLTALQTHLANWSADRDIYQQAIDRCLAV